MLPTVLKAAFLFGQHVSLDAFVVVVVVMLLSTVLA